MATYADLLDDMSEAELREAVEHHPSRAVRRRARTRLLALTGGRLGNQRRVERATRAPGEAR